MTAARPAEEERKREDQLLLSISGSRGGEKAGKAISGPGRWKKRGRKGLMGTP